MELIKVNNRQQLRIIPAPLEEQKTSSDVHFMAASTEIISIAELRKKHTIGRARMYQNMPYKDKKSLPQFPLSDSLVNLVVKDYYSDQSFCRNDSGDISLWRLFNLFTGANKMSYIYTFLDRSVGCSQFVGGLHEALNASRYHWFVN